MENLMVVQVENLPVVKVDLVVPPPDRVVVDQAVGDLLPVHRMVLLVMVLLAMVLPRMVRVLMVSLLMDYLMVVQVENLLVGKVDLAVHLVVLVVNHLLVVNPRAVKVDRVVHLVDRVVNHQPEGNLLVEKVDLVVLLVDLAEVDHLLVLLMVQLPMVSLPMD